MMMKGQGINHKNLNILMMHDINFSIVGKIRKMWMSVWRGRYLTKTMSCGIFTHESEN